jgi:hypothetical protein
MKNIAYVTSILMILILILACKSDQKTTKDTESTTEKEVPIEKSVEGIQNASKDLGVEEMENILNGSEVQELIKNGQLSEDQIAELQEQLKKMGGYNGRRRNSFGRT